MQQVTGGTVTLPADVLNGLGNAKAEKRKKQKVNSTSISSKIKIRKFQKKTRRSTSEDYHRRRSDDRYSPRYDDRRYRDDRHESRYNDPYVSQRSTHV